MFDVFVAVLALFAIAFAIIACVAGQQTKTTQDSKQAPANSSSASSSQDSKSDDPTPSPKPVDPTPKPQTVKGPLDICPEPTTGYSEILGMMQQNPPLVSDKPGGQLNTQVCIYGPGDFAIPWMIHSKTCPPVLREKYLQYQIWISEDMSKLHPTMKKITSIMENC